MTKLQITALLLAATIGMAGIANAHNDPNNPVGQCVQDAVQTRQSCTQVCRDDFQASVDTCRNVNHTCANDARQARQTCVQGVLQSLQDCIATGCPPTPTPQGALSHWEGQGGNGGDGQCGDGGDGMDDFTCREQCRQTVDVLSGLKACRDAFRTAISQCPVPTPTVTPTAKKK